MKKTKQINSGIIVFLVAVATAAITVASGVNIYNSLVMGEVAVKSTFDTIDAQLQGRSDLVSRLISSVQSYAEVEEKLIANVTAARTRMTEADSIDEKIAADNDLSDALKGILSMAKAHPELKANADFLALEAELSATEKRIAIARKDYNDSVMSYNRRLRSFPASILANVFGFEKYYAFTAGPDNISPPAALVGG